MRIASKSWPCVSWLVRRKHSIMCPLSNKNQPAHPIRRFLQRGTEAPLPPHLYAVHTEEWSEPSVGALSSEMYSITTKPTLKWKRLAVWYSAVKRVSTISYPNRDGDDNLFNWAVNPRGVWKREREKLIAFILQLTYPDHKKLFPGATLSQCSPALVFL